MGLHIVGNNNSSTNAPKIVFKGFEEGDRLLLLNCHLIWKNLISQSLLSALDEPDIIVNGDAYDILPGDIVITDNPDVRDITDYILRQFSNALDSIK